MTRFGPVEFPEVPAGDDVVVSATTFVAYGQCPEQAAARLRGIYGPESRASFVGNLAHRMFARHLTDGPIAPGEFAAACREEIGIGLNPKLVSLGLKPSALAAVIEEVGGLYDRFKQVGAEGLVGAEVSLEVEPAPGVLLRGSIDAVFDDGDRGVRLVDWKSGGLGDSTRQLAFYSMLWAMERGEVPGRVEAVSVASGERSDEVPTAAGVQGTADGVAAMVTDLRITWESGGAFPRTAGPWCRWCPLLEECDEGRAARVVFTA